MTYLLYNQAVLGRVLLGEMLNLQWYLGSVFMVCGLILLHKGSERAQSAQTQETGGTGDQEEKLKVS